MADLANQTSVAEVVASTTPATTTPGTLNIDAVNEGDRKNAGKIKLPAVKEIIGELLSVSEVELPTGDIFLLSFQGADNSVTTVSSSPAYWNKVGKIFAEGNICKVGFEARIKGQTGYKDANNVMVPHTGTGNNLSGITKFSATAFSRMLDSLTKDADITTLSTVEVERVGAIAVYLGAYASKK